MNTIKELKEELSRLERLHSGYMTAINSLVSQLEVHEQSEAKAPHKGGRFTKGHYAYKLKLTGFTWEVIGSELSCAPTNACRLARCHAKSNSLPWPIKQAGED